MLLLILIALKLCFGMTLGTNFPKSLSNDVPTPAGRIPRLVRRDEEPVTFWFSIAIQILVGLLLILFDSG
ncbi:hypothetical protein [Thalassoglobus sp.]|uniref:hypothetical protein n=1 Tax=Thalassoglobus sp. TaxID=2795869 RepID=UPI003AA94615